MGNCSALEPGCDAEIDESNPYHPEPPPKHHAMPVAQEQENPELDYDNPYTKDKVEGRSDTDGWKPISEPTAMKSTLGTMMVYPDNYGGKLPKGAYKQSDYQEMVAITKQIETGKSQISIDTSNFMDGVDPTDTKAYAKATKDADAFRSQYLGYLKDLVKTPTGLKLLEELNTSKHTTTITRGAKNETLPPTPRQEDARHEWDKGSDEIIHLDPTAATFQEPGQQLEPWMTDRPRFGFYHELVHAYHGARGDGGLRGLGDIDQEEEQTVGLNDMYANENYSQLPVSENKIRADFGKEQRPYYYNR